MQSTCKFNQRGGWNKNGSGRNYLKVYKQGDAYLGLESKCIDLSDTLLH